MKIVIVHTDPRCYLQQLALRQHSVGGSFIRLVVVDVATAAHEVVDAAIVAIHRSAVMACDRIAALVNEATILIIDSTYGAFTLYCERLWEGLHALLYALGDIIAEHPPNGPIRPSGVFSF